MQDEDSRATTAGATMRAVTRYEYGGPDVLRVGDVPVPEVKPDEVLVRVHAAGVDRGVWHLMTGTPYLARLAVGVRRPRNVVPGQDLAGVVEAVGARVSRFAVGDEVFGSGRGSFAEFAAAPEDTLVRKPAGLTFEQAAAVPVSAVTALKALHDVGRVTAGQHVAILGASGGVGSFAVQLAKAAGARVTGVCSAAKGDFVLSLGADRVIDHAAGDFAAGSPAYDLVLDIGGRPSVGHLRRALAPRGTAVIVGGEGGERLSGGMHRQLGAAALSPFVRQRLAMVIALVRAESLERLVALMGEGAVMPSIDRSFRLEQASEALAYLEAGRVRGKVVLAV
ncbi:NAD(P)-dependent alcohol dehydrogenase [Arthrobacter agilis]|uniref:NAD(P)-dependent alcohol dehydrogenase n=1 Tax=Arthrobacter agilis TaxID=37921 RepID=UPI00278141CA|nr:NAD(P)-dependent alcohol dehydrogenase [Arthrobacter agilis]MDQ0734949.1 NADPH:quinone reductase-like Zn-dependent oxidoreductase [Arthrobacter agilis]